MTLADSPAGGGHNGHYELEADRVQLVLKSASITLSGSSNHATSAALGRDFWNGLVLSPRPMPMPLREFS